MTSPKLFNQCFDSFWHVSNDWQGLWADTCFRNDEAKLSPQRPNQRPPKRATRDGVRSRRLKFLLMRSTP